MSYSSNNYHKNPEVSKNSKMAAIFRKKCAKKKFLSLIYHRENCLPEKWKTIKVIIIIKAERNEKRILIDLIKMDTLSFIHSYRIFYFIPRFQQTFFVCDDYRATMMIMIDRPEGKSIPPRTAHKRISIYWINNFIICPLLNVISHFHAYFNKHQWQYALHIYFAFVIGLIKLIERQILLKKNQIILTH